jgi:hypothetical protein
VLSLVVVLWLATFGFSTNSPKVLRDAQVAEVATNRR